VNDELREAIAAQEAETAERLMIEHVQRSRIRLIEMLDGGRDIDC